MPKKANINAYDAFALLDGRKLYKEQLCDVLVRELDAERILCISDTTDVLLKNQETTTSIAHTIEKTALGPRIEVIQTDFMDFRTLSEEELGLPETPKFGAHLPQNAFETRREYLKVDATKLKEDLSVIQRVDVILGKNCMCGCEGNGKLCGGIDISVKAQQTYLETLIEQGPSLIVLSGASAHFFPSDDMSQESVAKSEHAQRLYKEAKSNLLEVCNNLNAKEESPYRLKLVEPDTNLKFIMTDPKNENGYMLVAYDTRKINFQPTTTSLERKRENDRVESLRSKVSVGALIKQRYKIWGQKSASDLNLDKNNDEPDVSAPKHS